MLHLWGRLSSINVRKVVLCAQVLGLDLPRSDAGMAFGVVNTPDYRARNPNGLVPLLQDGDFTLWESNAIVRYLCARENRLYPASLKERFDAERWMDWQQTTLNPASGAAFKQWIRTPEAQRDHAVIAQSVAATTPLLEQLNTHLADHAYLTGAHFGMADIPVGCEIHRWFGLPQARPALPHLERWYASVSTRPTARSALDLPLS